MKRLLAIATNASLLWTGAPRPRPPTDDSPVRCPACCSSQIHVHRRGYSVFIGVFGMNKIKIICLKCGRVFAPPRPKHQPMSPRPWVTTLIRR